MSTTTIVAIIVGVLGALFFTSKRMARPSRDAIVPRIKNKAFVDAIAEIPPGHQDMPVYEPFVGDTLIAYALDLPGVFRMLTAGDMLALGMELDEVRSHAITNLTTKVAAVRAEPLAHDVWMLVTGDTLEASLLLLDDVWIRQAELVRGELVVAVPTRAIVLITGRSSVEGLAFVRDAVDEAQKHESTHNVTRKLFVRRDGRWEIFE